LFGTHLILDVTKPNKYKKKLANEAKKEEEKKKKIN